jgi:hypothetical protein
LPELISPSQIGPGILLGRSVWTHLAPSPPGDPCTPRHHPGYAYPPLDPEAGLAWGCGEGAHLKSSSNHQRSSSARRTASPPTGYSFGPRSPDRLLAAGLGSRRLTLHRPFPSAIAEGRRLALPPDGRRHPSGASHRSDGTVLDTRRPPRCRPGSLKELGRVPAQHPPRFPAPNTVNLGAPGF